jgi:superfamily I DNA/RNA helicase
VHCRPHDDASEFIRSSIADECSLRGVLPEDYVRRHLDAADAVVSALLGEPIEADVAAKVLETAGRSLEEIISDADEVLPKAESAGVLCTSFAGCKGLSAHHVFIVGMNDGHFPRKRGEITDDEICQLLVALSRARKSCTLVSTGRFGIELLRPSVFIEWLEGLLDPYRFSKDGLASCSRL